MIFNKNTFQGQSYDLLWCVVFLLSISIITFFSFNDKKVNSEASERKENNQKEKTDPYASWGRPVLVKVKTSSQTTVENDQENKVESKAQIPEELKSAEVAQKTVSTYIVKEGDVLSEIALNIYGSSRHTNFLKETNQISDSDYLQVGQVLKIPPLKGVVNKEAGDQNFFFYEVKENDSAWKIAEKFYGDGSLYTKIVQDNSKVFKDGIKTLKKGDRLKIRKD